MQAKQKVTLYLSPELHRRLKITAAIDSEPMSELAERALVFYLNHPEVVDETEASYGRTHRVYTCPDCATSVALQNGELVCLSTHAGAIPQEQHTVEQVASAQAGEEELVPC
jgi:hypothetical protein